jgi:Flp pilus assembly protein TadG
MSRRSHRRARPLRLRGDDGAALLELALILPFITMLVLGVFEFGTAWRDRTILTTALRGGDRVESQGPAQGITATDYYALQTFYATANQMVNVTLTKVIVFKGHSMPSGCTTINVTGAAPAAGFGVAGSCVVYNQAQINAAISGNFSNFGCPASGVNSPGWDSSWCISTRNDSTSPDWVGMYAEYKYTPVTSLIGGTQTFTETAVYRIEPSV